jgi:predicted HD phosphohydrolase
VDNIVKSGIGWLDNAPVFRYLVVSQILYHEIGHHIHAAHQPAHAEKEDVAESWGGKLSRSFYRQRFWYLYPFLMVAARLALRARKYVSPKARKP